MLIVPYHGRERSFKRFMSHVGIVLFILVIGGVFVTLLINDASTIKSVSLPSSINAFGNEITITNLIDNQKVREELQSTISRALSAASDFFFEIITLFVFILFVLPTYKYAVKRGSEYFKDEKKYFEFIKKTENNIRDYITLKSWVSLLTAILTGGILYYFGVGNATLLALATFLLNYIPNIGSFIAVVIAWLYAILIDGFTIGNSLIVAVVLIVVQFIIGSIIEPKITGSKFKISPITVILGLFFWGYLWGVWGMFFSVPLTMVIKNFATIMLPDAKA